MPTAGYLGPGRAQTRVRPRVLESGSRSDWPYVELPWRSSVPSRAAEHAVCLVRSSIGMSRSSVSLLSERGALSVAALLPEEKC